MDAERITEMEQRLNRAECAIGQMEQALEAYGRVQVDRYLGSEEWHADRADDEAERLPEGLARGVLGEDAIWDLLERNRDVLERMGGLSKNPA